ncbi:hypothetical protein GKC29_25355 [Micromonospora sp. WMMC415]|uniref:hypothetical protein n=1 Tax=Micromonospora sp. WMMC415 TaxID=2675222 RepID=UPI0012B4C9A5|nr:hypothetical protein [Micromonospora sp. WMMC415]QGN49822.1 hypothetical protein GKC29_25355 [Micromonospora sp. WMMC415]
MEMVEPGVARVTSKLALVSLAASLLTVSGATQAEAAEPVRVPPAAAMLPEIVMTCSEGRTDLNHADVPELVSVLAVAPPVAERVVHNRPYLSARDLSVVEGIGPGQLDRILAEGKVCATPPGTPPPSSEHCAASDKVDLQSASVDDLVRLLKLARPTAERLVDARPFATLRHITPERVAGVGKGRLDELIGRSCLTPMPVRTADSSWRWAYPSLPTTVARDGYALHAPAGIIDDPGGAWLQIRPLPSPPQRLPGPAYPMADFHIHGQWRGGNDRAEVTVPAAKFAATFAGEDWQPYLLHWRDAHRTVAEPVVGADVRVDPISGAVTGHVNDLSVLEWAVRKANWVLEPAASILFGDRFPAPGCPNEPWSHQGDTNRWTHNGAEAHLDGALLNLPGNPVPPAGFLIKHCVQTGAGSSNWGPDVKVQLRNNTGTIQKLAHYSGDVTVAGDDSLETDLITLALTTVNTAGAKFLGPGDTGSAAVPAGTAGTVEMQPDRLRSLARVALDKTLGVVLDKLDPALSDPTLRQRVFQLVACTYDAVRASSAKTDFHIAREFALALFNCFNYENFYISLTALLTDLANRGAITPQQADLGANGLLKARELVKWLEWGQIAVDLVDSSVWGSLGTVPLRVEHYAAKPIVDGLGRHIGHTCIRRTGYTWSINAACQDSLYAGITRPVGGGGNTGLPPARIVRNSTGNAWLFTTDDRIMRPIRDGGTYLCLARHYAVDWDADITAYRGAAHVKPENAPDAVCDGARPATRDLSPGQVTSDAIVLRESSGRSWVLQGNERVHIPTGREFICWVNAQHAANLEFHVWDQVTADELARFPVSPTITHVSNCGDPEDPEF